jgi:hypothetical protein
MRALLRIWFLLVVLLMLGLTTWASLHENVLVAFLRLARDPWGLATLADAYFAFLAFWVWVAWKEGCWFSRVAWLLAIMLLGNLAMAAYVLIELARVDGVEALLTRRKPCSR